VPDYTLTLSDPVDEGTWAGPDTGGSERPPLGGLFGTGDLNANDGDANGLELYGTAAFESRPAEDRWRYTVAPLTLPPGETPASITVTVVAREVDHPGAYVWVPAGATGTFNPDTGQTRWSAYQTRTWQEGWDLEQVGGGYQENPDFDAPLVRRRPYSHQFPGNDPAGGVYDYAPPSPAIITALSSTPTGSEFAVRSAGSAAGYAYGLTYTEAPPSVVPTWDVTNPVYLHLRAANDAGFRGVRPVYRITQVRVTVTTTAASTTDEPWPYTPVGVVDPLRQLPRTDGLGTSSARRVVPASRSVQRSNRVGPGAYI
jgi:hypothetical protein